VRSTLAVPATIADVGDHAAKRFLEYFAANIRNKNAINPAHAVRGPTHVVRRGKTPVLTAEEARQLLYSIDTTTLVGCATAR